jgi:hypothetical protein
MAAAATSAGVLMGAATLVRPVSLPFLAVFAVAWLASGAGWRRTLARTAVVTAGTDAVLAPSVVRNAIVMDAAVLSTNTGDNLCMSRRVGGTGAFEFPNDRCNAGFDDLPRPEYEIARDEHGRDVALEVIRDHPGEELRLWWRPIARRPRGRRRDRGRRVLREEDRFIPGDRRDLLKTVANGWYVVAGGLGAVGLVLAVARRPAGLVVALAPPALLLSVVAFFGDPRFKVPALPFLAVGVGVLADRLAARPPVRRDAPATT